MHCILYEMSFVLSTCSGYSNVIFIINKLLATHFTAVIIHEHILSSLLADVCDSCLTDYTLKHCLLQTQNTWPFVIHDHYGTSKTEPGE